MSSLTPRIDRFEPNRIINGNLDFWQRGTSFSSMTSATWMADRLLYVKVGSAVHDSSRSTDVPNVKSNYSLLLDVTTAQPSLAAGDLFSIEYRMEGYDLSTIAEETFTLMFKVKAPKAGTYCVSFRNDAADRSYVAEYTVDVADTWETKTISLTHNSAGTWNYDSQLGMRINWMLAAGTDWQTSPGTWQSGNFLTTANQVNAVDDVNNNFKIAQIQILPGDLSGITDVPFRRAGRNIVNELQLCQRYFEKSMGYFVTPLVDQQATHYNCIQWQSVNFTDQILFRVEKRATPTLEFHRASGSGGGADQWRVTKFATESAVLSETSVNTSPVANFNSAFGFVVRLNVTIGNNGGELRAEGNWSADAEL